jgi:hypothetical protein
MLSSAGVRGTWHATLSSETSSNIGELAWTVAAWPPSATTPHSHAPATSAETEPSINTLTPLLWCARSFTQTSEARGDEAAMKR